MDYQYGQVEAALIDVLHVTDDQLGSFRAKIRRFRQLGIPELPKVGSGTKVQYQTHHVVDLAMALIFDRFGIVPKMTKYLASVRRGLFVGATQDVFVVVTQIPEIQAYTCYRKDLDRNTKDLSVYFVVNATAIEADVLKALK